MPTWALILKKFCESFPLFMGFSERLYKQHAKVGLRHCSVCGAPGSLKSALYLEMLPTRFR